MDNKFIYMVIFCLLLSACSPIRTTGNIIKYTSKATWETAKFTGKTAKFTGKTVYKGARGFVYMIRGKEIVPLKKQGNSYYTDVLINKKIRANLLLDTGASCMQISRSLAKKLRINYDKADSVSVGIAGGYLLPAKEIILKEVRLGRTRVTNVRTLIFDNDQMGDDDGLLGMSFLDNFNFYIDPRMPELVLRQRVDI